MAFSLDLFRLSISSVSSRVTMIAWFRGIKRPMIWPRVSRLSVSGSGSEQFQSERLKTGASGGGIACLPRPDVFDALLLDTLQTHRQGANQRVSHGEGRVSGFEFGTVFLQIEVEGAGCGILIDLFPR